MPAVWVEEADSAWSCDRGAQTVSPALCRSSTVRGHTCASGRKLYCNTEKCLVSQGTYPIFGPSIGLQSLPTVLAPLDLAAGARGDHCPFGDVVCVALNLVIVEAIVAGEVSTTVLAVPPIDQIALALHETAATTVPTTHV